MSTWKEARNKEGRPWERRGGWKEEGREISLRIVFFSWPKRGREKAMAPHSSTPAWKTHGQRSLVGCSPWGHRGSDTTERLHFHFSLSCIGEGNGSPLQCSCLENPRDGGAWWAAVSGVAQSGTRLKWLSSSYFNYTNILLIPSYEYVSLTHLQFTFLFFTFWAVPHSLWDLNSLNKDGS